MLILTTSLERKAPLVWIRFEFIESNSVTDWLSIWAEKCSLDTDFSYSIIVIAATLWAIWKWRII